jgi:Flp pilus assembly protein TadD
MHPLLAERSRAAARLGAGVPDVVVITRSCRGCVSFVDDDPPRSVTTVEYRDLDSLVATARKLGARLFDEAGACTTCGRRAPAVAVDYHAWHAAMGRDLVVRTHRRLFTVEADLAWWTPDLGFQPARPTEMQRHLVRRDAAFRALRLTLDRSGVRGALPLVEDAAASFRGDPELLGYLPQLLGAGKTDLVGQIAAAHIALKPNDAEGYFWLAMAVYDNVNRGALPRAYLVQAEGHLERALAIKQDFADADCALCHVARARGDEEAALRCFARAVEKYPGNARLLGDLAALELKRAPVDALEHFRRAERLDPNDADFALGSARALVALGRLVEARDATERARALSPQHPRLREVELRLAAPPMPAVLERRAP